jgi:hypothetical protein
VATSEEHRDLAQQLLLAYADRQAKYDDDPDRPQAYLDRRQLEHLFVSHEQKLPRLPSSPLLLPRLRSGDLFWPTLGLSLPDRSQASAIPPIELLSLEVILVPPQQPTPTDQERRCVGFRFEPPSCLPFGKKSTGQHDYYHMQFVRTPRVHSNGREALLPLPDKFPAVPVRARDFGSLVLALAVALYGRDYYLNDREIDLAQDTRDRMRAAYQALGYWDWSVGG